jgi:cytochrome oxidase Cu insertion factor (SCO1/SenC/PrrC family)
MRLFMTVGPTILAVGAALTVLVARYGSPMDAEAGMSSGIAPSTAAGEPSPSQGPLPEAYARTALPAPDFTLVDQHGAEVTLSKLDRPVVLSFAFAHCRTMCPLLIRTLQEWSKRDDAARARGAELLVVTLDPEHDTPETLPELAKAWSFGPRRRVLSGKVDSVLAVLEAYKVPRVKDATTGEITHPGLVYVVDTEGKIAYTLNNPSVQWLTDAVLRAQATRTAAADAPVKSGG